MGRLYRERMILDSMDNHVVTFPNNTVLQLNKKLSEKAWEGSATREDPDWQPSEAHAVYECTQVEGPQLGSVAIVKVRIEVPYELPPSEDPRERAKHASGMRLNGATEQEIESLEILTYAGCSATPQLLAVKYEVQDESVLKWKELDMHWWMPGGYVVYILMAKLPAQPLDINSFWNEKLFTARDRHAIRKSFRQSWLEVLRLGVLCLDTKLENLMWDRANQKCYIIDLEETDYIPDSAYRAIWSDNTYFNWNLARSWGEPSW